MVLSPYLRNEDDRKANPHLSKYYFLPNDEETEIYLDRVFEFSITENYKFNKKGQRIFITANDFDKKIGIFKEDKTELIPSIDRFKKTRKF